MTLDRSNNKTNSTQKRSCMKVNMGGGGIVVIHVLMMMTVLHVVVSLVQVGPSKWKKTILSPNINLPPVLSGAVATTLRDSTYGTRLFVYGGESTHGLIDELRVFKYNVLDQWASYAEASSETCSTEGWYVSHSLLITCWLLTLYVGAGK